MMDGQMDCSYEISVVCSDKVISKTYRHVRMQERLTRQINVFLWINFIFLEFISDVMYGLAVNKQKY
jgi:hypothetical protein